MGHYSNLYDQEDAEKDGGTTSAKKKSSNIRMITVNIPEGSYIIPPGQQLKWAKKIIKQNKEK